MKELETCHRGQFHMGETDALDTEFPVYAVQGFRLHYFAVLAQHVVADDVGGVLLDFE